MGAVELEQLREDEACRTSTEQEDFNTDWRVKLVEAMERTCCGLEKGRLLVGDVLDYVALALVVDDVLCEATV